MHLALRADGAFELLAELAESEARGELAEIYAAIRHWCAVPYVSSMQRHLATRPGWLEWAWRAVAPAFESGVAQEAAWRASAPVMLAPLPPLSGDVLSLLGVDESGMRAIRGLCDGFVRVSPTNLMFSGLVQKLLRGAAGGGRAYAAWQPPAPVPAPPPLVSIASMPPPLLAVLRTFEVEVDGHPFIPGLYRMLAHWPGFLAYIATVLPPRMAEPASAQGCVEVVRAIDGVLDEALAVLPSAAHKPLPPRAEHAAVLAAMERYRLTSPQMVLLGRLLRDCLPQVAGSDCVGCMGSDIHTAL